ncbi:hypothetical protein HPB50_028340 [Hyalomma asiaticum]|nr:hypothetical protein HPB50_028340 [Hyalomma asiaticum]
MNHNPGRRIQNRRLFVNKPLFANRLLPELSRSLRIDQPCQQQPAARRSDAASARLTGHCHPRLPPWFPAESATCGETVLYTPVERKMHFLSTTRDAIAAYLAGIQATARVRVNLRRNVVAVDTVPGADVRPLASVEQICEVPVSARVLSRNSCEGLLFGVDPDIDIADVAQNIDSPSAAARADAKDAVINALAAAVRTLLEFVPADSPAHHLCAAALAAQQALQHHG